VASPVASIEKIFSDHHRSCRATPVKNEFSSWEPGTTIQSLSLSG
jgi:hypothetical protein